MSTVKIAQFKDVEHPGTICYFTFTPRDGYVRTSEWVEVDFPPIADSGVLDQQLVTLEKLKERAFTEYEKARKAIRDRKAALKGEKK